MNDYMNEGDCMNALMRNDVDRTQSEPGDPEDWREGVCVWGKWRL